MQWRVRPGVHRVADDVRRMEELMNATFSSRLFRGELLLLNVVLLLYEKRSVHLLLECDKFNFIGKQHIKRLLV